MNHKDILKQGGKEIVGLPIYERSRNTIASGVGLGVAIASGYVLPIALMGGLFLYNLDKSIKLKCLPMIETTTHWGSKVDTTWLKREMNYQKVKIRNWRDSSEKY